MAEIMDIQTRQCMGCGVDVMVEVPEGVHPRFLRLLELVKCDPCVAAMDANDRVVSQRHREATQKTRISRSQIPAMLRGRKLAELDTEGRRGVLEAAQRWVDGGLLGLLLTGDIGVGKTTIAAAAAWEYVQRERLRWSSVPSLMAGLAGGFDSPGRAGAIRVLEGAGALVLDDLDKTRPSPYAAEQLFTAVDNRLTARAPLLVTTNLTLAEFAGRFPEPFGQAIASRLAGYCEVWEVAGQDRRTAKAAA